MISRYEQAYLSSTLGQKTGMYWTDVTDLRSPGTYRFFDNGYPYLTYTNWGDQRPAGTYREFVISLKSTVIIGTCIYVSVFIAIFLDLSVRLFCIQ